VVRPPRRGRDRGPGLSGDGYVRAHVSDDPAELIALLDDPEARWAAANRLSELGHRDAAPKLLTLLRAGDPHVRCAAAVSLGQLRATEAVEPLVEVALTDDEGFVRAWALNSLGRIGDPRPAERLRPLLDIDMRPDVAVTAARTLASLGDSIGSERLAALRRGERWILPSLRRASANAPPSRVVWFAFAVAWVAGVAGLLRWWAGWPQLVLGVGIVFLIGEAWLAARQAAARRAGIYVVSRPRSRARLRAIAIGAAVTATLAFLLSFEGAQLGVYVATFYFVRWLVEDAAERRRVRSGLA
jgi:hypothetical protein